MASACQGLESFQPGDTIVYTWNSGSIESAVIIKDDEGWWEIELRNSKTHLTVPPSRLRKVE